MKNATQHESLDGTAMLFVDFLHCCKSTVRSRWLSDNHRVGIDEVPEQLAR